MGQMSKRDGEDGKKIADPSIHICVDRSTFFENADDLRDGDDKMVGRMTHCKYPKQFYEEMEDWIGEEKNVLDFLSKVPTGEIQFACYSGGDFKSKVEDEILIIEMGTKRLGFTESFKPLVINALKKAPLAKKDKSDSKN